MDDRELDIVEMEGEDGAVLRLAVERYFYYNVEEYVLLSDNVDGQSAEDVNHYVMKVQPLPEEGEDMEEFVPVDEDLMDKLVEAAETVFQADEEEE